jgi:hypothetical protein
MNKGFFFGGCNCIFKRGKGQVGEKKTWESTSGIKDPGPYLHYYYYWLSTFSFAYNFHQEEPNYNFNGTISKNY